MAGIIRMTSKSSQLRTGVLVFTHKDTLATNSLASMTSLSSTATREDTDLLNAKPFEDIPGPKGLYNFPLLGFFFHLKPFTNYTMRNTNLIFNNMVKRYGPIFKMQTDEPTVMLSDPEDFGHIFRNEGQYPIRPSFDLCKVYHKRTGFRPDLSCEQGAEWWRLKAPTHRALINHENIHRCLPQMNEVADAFVRMLTAGELNEKELEATFMAYAAESAGIPLFNKRLGFLDSTPSEETRKFIDATETMFSMLQSSVLGASTMFRYYRSKDYRMYEEARNLIKFTIQKHMETAYDELMEKKRMKKSDCDEPNVLSSLLDDKTYTLDDVSLMMESVYIAAIDSSASTIQALFHNMATHPDKQEKLRKEIHDVLGLHKPLTLEDLDNMPYLKAVIRENYRYTYPIVIGTFRRLPVDIAVKGYRIPAMTQIYNLNGQACQNYFDQPEKFLPERWLRNSNAPLSEKDKIRRWAVLPFGYGKRSCSGRKVVEQEMNLILAKTLQKAHIDLHDGCKNVEFGYGLFVKPVNPFKFKFTSLI